MISLIDTHAHIDLPVFDEDREAMLARSRAAGVMATIVIGHNPDRWLASERLCQLYPCLVRTVGVHPNDASIWSDTLLTSIDAELRKGDAVAVGETGLDFFRDSASADLQRQAFIAQIQLARRFDLPIVIHQRSAETDVLDLLIQHGPVRGVMHCFSGDGSFARACLDAGLVLGIGGVVTYPKSQSVRDGISSVPLDALILETDSPYLAPQTRRGKRNEPALVREAAAVLASIFDVSIDEIARQTTATAIQLFGPRLAAAVDNGMVAEA